MNEASLRDKITWTIKTLVSYAIDEAEENINGLSARGYY